LEKGYSIHLKKLESFLPKDDFGHVWLNWSKRRFLNDPTPVLNFCNYLPFEEDMALYLNKLEFHLPKDNLYQV
jgi:hypothetical protein